MINYALTAIWLVLSSTCHFLIDTSLQSADKDQQEMRAVAEKPPDAVVKSIRIEFTAASRGPPCDSTVFYSFLFPALSATLGLVSC